MELNKKEIVKIYTLIKGIYQGIKETEYKLVDESTYEQYNSLIENMYEITNDEYFKMLEIEYEDTEIYQVYKLFLERYPEMHNKLFSEEGTDEKDYI